MTQPAPFPVRTSFTKPIPFVNNQESGYEELGGASPLAMNIIVDGKGVVRRRPGIKVSTLAPSTVIDANGLIGIRGTRDRQLFAVGAAGAERPIYNITASGAALIGGGVPPMGLRGTARPIFAETEMLLVIAGGDLIEKIQLATAGSSRLGGNPPKASHVIANHLRLLANDVLVDRSAIRFSDIAGGDTSFAGLESWAYAGFGTSGYFTAEGKPDDVAAIMENTNEVHVLGTATVQVFLPDPTLTYAPSATTELGTMAPYSVIKVDQNFAWLDHLKRFVLTDSRSYQEISKGIARTLNNIAVVDDCFGYRLTMGDFDALIWTFPTDGRTFCYQTGVGWSQWAGWTDNWAPFKVNCCHTLPAWTPDGINHGTGPALVGTTDGFIGELDLNTNTDLGGTIKSYVRTGFLDHGTQKLKHCQAATFVLRRGETTNSTAPQATLRFADSPGNWSSPIPIDLGQSGDRDPVVILRSLGTYRTRQWEFSFTGTESLSLVSAMEDIEISDL